MPALGQFWAMSNESASGSHDLSPRNLIPIVVLGGLLIIAIAVGNSLGVWDDDQADYTPPAQVGFPDETDDEIIEGCLRGGSDYETCKEVVLPLVRASDHDGDGTRNAHDADYQRDRYGDD